MVSVCPDCLAELSAEQDSCTVCGFVRPADGWLPDPLTGLIIGDRYRLEGRLGAGGMACVFRASRIGALGGQVAVKVLAPRFSRTVIARRFEREAQVVARLTNPHIVRIYDFDTFSLVPADGGRAVEQSLYYIAMELIDGQTLSKLLKSQGKVNFLWGIDILRQLARGLEEAHAQGIVHRDLKPSNVILVQQRSHTHVKILDFGIAALSVREDQPGSAHEKLTQTGFVSGTPDYMAPEQAVGDSNVGPAADMFSLGIIAFEMFSGRKPFEGPTMESLLARVADGAPSLREVVSDASFPPELYRIVDKLLARVVRDRYQNAGELLDDLSRFPTLQTTPDFVPPAVLLERYPTGASRPAYGGSVEVAARAGSSSDPTPQRTSAQRPVAKKRSSAVAWILALLVLGGAGAAVALAITSAPPSTGETEATASPTGEADTAVTDSAAARPDTIPQEVTPKVSAADVPTFLEGRRPPLEDGFMEVRLERGGQRLLIAEPSTAVPLFRPLPLRIGLDDETRPTRIVSGTLAMKLARDGRDAGHTEGRGREDGRLVIDLPPRPLADSFVIALELVLGGDRRVRFELGYDARKGTFELKR